MNQSNNKSGFEPADAGRLDELKRQLRKQAHLARRGQQDKDGLSEHVLRSTLRLAEVERAESAMFYVDVRDEVRTKPALSDAIAGSRRIVVPWCNDSGELELFHLESMDELASGMFGILEPALELRCVPHKCVGVSSLDAILVPGLAFDRIGGRLGHGRGYYDRLLRNARADCALIGLAWECQIFPEIPMGTQDIFMDFVVTERAIYEGRGQ